jgi:hypothetical protein
VELHPVVVAQPPYEAADWTVKPRLCSRMKLTT